MKNRDFNSLMDKVLVGIIVILYTCFLYMDFYNKDFFIASYYIKYICILLCFVLSIFANKNPLSDIEKHRDVFLLQLALFITAIADLCLVIFDFYILGVVLFSLVQITYSVRYASKKPKATLIKFLIIFLCIAFSYCTANIFIEEINILFPVSLFYFICLLFSVSGAIVAFKDNLYPSPSKYMIVFGMIFFLLCDICVALSNLSGLLPLIGHSMGLVQHISSLLIWFFYLPSQLLLALSGNDKI
ncbi:lysoplasmalogenase family protein [Clostridium estertheticum]|uniref:lysoplasmalogenase family protein n=1 Tax=Clostridium estertheticum TaxID=238834 RepID=UPI0013E95D44|nr:lysoplasmalogenase family protein [Clostridium estertheticum]MBZ9687035.1 lysoplasmalogenase family protein [Clostridium estertheticum]